MSFMNVFFLWQQCRQIVFPILQRPTGSRITCFSSRNIASYSSEEENKIMKIVNQADEKTLVRHGISKLRLQNIVKWRETKGKFNSVKDVLLASGNNERVADKFFKNILAGAKPEIPKIKENVPKKSALKKIRGQVLQPALTDSMKNDIKSVTSLHLTMSDASWCQFRRSDYSLQAWGHHALNVPDDTKLHVPAIMEIAWSIVSNIPPADVYVLEGLPTTLRAGGSDPYNPKVISVNLQKSQLIAMIFALLNGRRNSQNYRNSMEKFEEGQMFAAEFHHRVYMLRSSLPARLFNTLVGSERVSTEQTVQEILKSCEGAGEAAGPGPSCTVPPPLQQQFCEARAAAREALGRSLLLAMTFMELCIYEQSNRANNL